MSKYKSIAVFYGSDSSEWEVACRSGEFVASRLDESLYDVYQIFARFGKWQLVAYRKRNSMRVAFPEGARPEVDKTDCSVSVLGEKIKFDFIYIMQHGQPGENGLLQGYFEMLGIPYSGCDAFVRKGSDLEAFADKVSARLKYPVFVKPTNGGSSFGITKVRRREDLVSAVNYAFAEGPMVIVEQGIPGRELTCAAYFDGTGVRALPAIEIVTENDYFDYDAKYNGHSSEICPAPISDEELAVLQQTTCRIYSQLGCRGIVRVDYILTPEGELTFLEVNTIPGMTSASLVPKMVRAAGMDITDFLTQIIENS